jgi:hypothetical protein
MLPSDEISDLDREIGEPYYKNTEPDLVWEESIPPEKAFARAQGAQYSPFFTHEERVRLNEIAIQKYEKGVSDLSSSIDYKILKQWQEELANVQLKVKDPNAPKRSLSPYLFYASERRPELKKEKPDMTFDWYTRQIAAEWTKMKYDSSKTKKYDDLAALDKERYTQEMVSYEAAL